MEDYLRPRDEQFDPFGMETPFAPALGDYGEALWNGDQFAPLWLPPASVNVATRALAISGPANPPSLMEMLAIPGRFDDPKRDRTLEMDGTLFSEFLRGADRRAFAAQWLGTRSALVDAMKEPNADLSASDISKAWFVIHDVGVGGSLKDRHYYPAKQGLKQKSVHGFLNRGGFYAATHDFAANKSGTVYEFLSRKGRKIAGGKTINIETVPDVEVRKIGKDKAVPPPSNVADYASVGLKQKAGTVTYYKWTNAAFDTLADLYVLASVRAGHLLTITVHKEIDRNLGRSVIWNEYSAKELRNAGPKVCCSSGCKGPHLARARDCPSNYHGDPYAFNIQALYDRITTRLNALGGKQMPPGARYGVHPARLRKDDGSDITNGSSHLHEFPHQSDPVVKRDTNMKAPGWWNASSASENEEESAWNEAEWATFATEEAGAWDETALDGEDEHGSACGGHVFEGDDLLEDTAFNETEHDESEDLAWLDLEAEAPCNCVKCRSAGEELAPFDVYDAGEDEWDTAEADREDPESWAEARDDEVESPFANFNAFQDDGQAEGFDDEENLLYELEEAKPASPSIKVDYSLKDIASGKLGALPQTVREALLSGRTRAINDFANQYVWAKYPQLDRIKLDPKNRSHKNAIRDYKVFVRHAKALVWFSALIEIIDRHRGDLPREFLLGWMAKESDGNVDVVTKLGERGYFQVHPAEAADHLQLAGSAFEALSSDREASVREGIKLVRFHRDHLSKTYELGATVPLTLQLTKARHGLPGLLRKSLETIKKRPEGITWAGVANGMGQTAVGQRVVSNVEDVFSYASRLKPLSDLVPGAAIGVRIPEWESEEVPGVLGRNKPRTQVKNAALAPYRWICLIEVRKGDKVIGSGTGFLISDCHVLTAAHVVDEAAANWAQHTIEVTFAKNWDKDLGSLAVRGRPQLIANSNQLGNDFALLTLNEDVGKRVLADKTIYGHFNQSKGPAKDVQAALACTAGYPGDKDRQHRKMMEAMGKLSFQGDVAHTDVRLLWFDGDTAKGQSGSPIWIRRNWGSQLVGMAIAATQPLNRVLHLNTRVWKQIREWIADQDD